MVPYAEKRTFIDGKYLGNDHSDVTLYAGSSGSAPRVQLQGFEGTSLRACGYVPPCGPPVRWWATLRRIVCDVVPSGRLETDCPECPVGSEPCAE